MKKLGLIGSFVLLLFVLSLVLVWAVSVCHASVGRNRANSLGISQTYDNPYVYLVGFINHYDEVGGATNVTFNPYGTALLNTETRLFCTDLRPRLDQGVRTSLYIVTYRPRASRLFHGVACYDVFSILEVKL